MRHITAKICSRFKPVLRQLSFSKPQSRNIQTSQRAKGFACVACLQGSALGHMSAMFRLLTGSSGAAAVKQPALLEPLRIALAACLEGQAAAVLRSPAETALHELLADALLPQAGPAHGQGLDLLLMVLGTFVRRWLER